MLKIGDAHIGMFILVVKGPSGDSGGGGGSGGGAAAVPLLTGRAGHHCYCLIQFFNHIRKLLSHYIRSLAHSRVSTGRTFSHHT